MASSSSNVVGVHYRVGKKIGEGSFGVIFEGTNLLNNQQVAIKFTSHSRLVRLCRVDCQFFPLS
ncbi:Protein kinase domain-containing protein [Trichoderma simmonsii]|uniref:Protein kinase domain-containing protein n=1 Tax=Trichoderma simmonsii TaxID=1491479 RepID=A0A8G0L681_9HYPO|nr:Protein kinase domain-containing protein [Trichoderma simmonsii]